MAIIPYDLIHKFWKSKETIIIEVMGGLDYEGTIERFTPVWTKIKLKDPINTKQLVTFISNDKICGITAEEEEEDEEENNPKEHY